MNRENHRIFKAIIIGAGASGLALAIKLSQKFGGENIALIERLDRVGKKLLTTGNGQCNLTNSNCKISDFHGKNIENIENILNKYGSNAVCSFFEDLGILLTCDGDKIYPLSKQASSVLDALRLKLSSLKTNLILNTKLIGLNRENGVYKITAESGEVYYSYNAIVAVGGSAQKHLGTDGSSYLLLEKLGHKKTDLYPSIVQLKADVKKLKGLKGLKQKVMATALLNGKSVATTGGEIMFTDFGLSGNVAFYLSSYFAGKSGMSIALDFCPELSHQQLFNALCKKQKNCNYLTAEYLLQGIMNNKIASAILKNSNIDLSLPIDKVDVKAVTNLVKNYQISVLGTLGFDNAQVTKGGIELSGFNSQTLESKLSSGLYATGEVLDVDGNCGGYNLTWAFSSAFLVADAIL